MQVVRDGAVESLHDGHVSVVDAAGRVLFTHGDAEVVIYPRSAVKPFQAAAVLDMLPVRPPADEVAVMAASHVGSAAQQAVVLRVLDRAGLSADVLRCPEALPSDAATVRRGAVPTRLAHNCSGKHAGFLLATVGAGADAERYLRPDAPVQRAVRSLLADICGDDPRGPGVDGCGAPAWRLRLASLAQGFARLADSDRAVGAADPYAATTGTGPRPPALAAVAAAMRGHPDLVGGDGIIDSELLRAEPLVVAKRGAEGVLLFAARVDGAALGIAIKVADGATRALGPIAAAVLDRLGLRAPRTVRRPVVLGGGVPHGVVEPTPDFRAAVRALAS